MDKIFWLERGRIAGRPGPDSEPWQAAGLRAAGIGAVLSVNGADECEPAALAAADIEHACIPFSCNAPPRPGDVALCREALPRAYAFAADALSRSRAVLVHCTFGKDRTGMFMAYFLMREHGLDHRAAMACVRDVRPIAFSAQGWEVLAHEVLGNVEHQVTSQSS